MEPMVLTKTATEAKLDNISPYFKKNQQQKESCLYHSYMKEEVTWPFQMKCSGNGNSSHPILTGEANTVSRGKCIAHFQSKLALDMEHRR